jgi:hypothetical protein
MTDDPSADIDSILASELPEREFDPADSEMGQRRQRMIELLQEAADKLGRTPSMGDFNELEYEVSAGAIKHTFESWDAAKAEAGLETIERGTVAAINETYFRAIDSPEKTYWLGTLIGRSSMQRHPGSENYKLSLGRVEDKAYFVTAFAEAIDSEYSLQWVNGSKSDKQQVQMNITNPTFVNYLLAAGYPEPDADQPSFPEIPEEYRTAFIRGFLESSGYFTTSGWRISVDTTERGNTLQEWFEGFGAKRPSVCQPQGKPTQVRVTNAFDIASVFESLYPELLDTEPSWTPYPKQIIEFLAEEHPYPENLEYVDC